MEISSFLDTLMQNLYDTSILEIIAVIFGLLSVWFAKKANILVYPSGIISVLIYIYICQSAQLFADMGINAFYFIMSVYGWIMWTRKVDNKKKRPISFNTRKDNFISIVFFIFSLFIILFLLKYFKADDDLYWSTNIPYIDTFTTAIFIVGMWLMAMKKVENWLYWIVGDLISIPMYFYKGLVFTSLQFLIFLIIAILGYLEWRKMVKTNQELA